MTLLDEREDGYGAPWGGTTREQSDDEGIASLPISSNVVNITLSDTFSPATYKVELFSIENTVDEDSSLIFANVTGKETTYFTVALSAATDTANYKLPWRISR